MSPNLKVYIFWDWNKVKKPHEVQVSEHFIKSAIYLNAQVLLCDTLRCNVMCHILTLLKTSNKRIL